ncbi:MAG TPA: primosomal protein N' [Clostridiales bacterium]|nr:primosomal protein N' [Clostridiales bacterium]HQP70159.1 primosomal protein N' [Clostridiales bacterium]
MLLNVTLPLPVEGEFSYLPPKNGELIPEYPVGYRVAVIFNKRTTVGFVTSISEKEARPGLSEVLEFFDDHPVISAEMLKFIRWISEYYLCPLGEVIRLAVPSLLQIMSPAQISLSCSQSNYSVPANETGIYRFIDQFGPVNTSEVIKLFGERSRAVLRKYRSLGIVESSPVYEKKRGVFLKAYKRSKRTDDDTGRLLDRIFCDRCVILLKESKERNLTPALVKKALGSGLIESVNVRKDHLGTLLTENIAPAGPPELNEEQSRSAAAVSSELEKGVHRTFLLYGITGSGKTMVYISVIEKALALGKNAILLVPEISLTPQTVRRFRSYFGDRIAILHSRLTDIEKLDSWDRIREGKCSIVIGPRSAIFAPLKNIGVIIVDEEHDSSYKQSEMRPRYCARSSAVMRGFFNGAPVILGSATPSPESYFNAMSGKYSLLEIKNRFSNAVLPKVRTVKKEIFTGLFEKPVIDVFRRELDLGRKIMILQNRRGYSSQLVCRSCGSPAKCPNCSVSLTYHLDRNRMICHYCGYYEKGSEKCASCGSENVVFKGTGTEQVEEEIRSLFKDVPVYRMDYDSTRSKDGHAKILDKFALPGAAVLVGTQMIAKGLDFHQVSVVCIVNIDGELVFPDFRSDEKAVQLIEQVSGRAGRGDIPGIVLIQTFNENNPVLKFALSHDYTGFLKEELNVRKVTFYPPYSRLIKITLSSKIPSELKNAADELYSILSGKNKVCTVYRPVDKMIHKVNNIFRLYILIKSSIINDKSGSKVRDLVSDSLGSFRCSSSVRTDVDVDPADLM